MIDQLNMSGLDKVEVAIKRLQIFEPPEGYHLAFGGADMHNVDMHKANIRGADMRGADVDYSCWPLWCGSFDVRVDKRIAAQLAYHFCRLDCDDADYIKARNAIIDFANQFHRVDECGRLEEKNENM